MLEKYGLTVSVKCNILSKKFRDLCNENGCWISSKHISGSHNTIADHMSRTFKENTEWMLSPFLLQRYIREISVYCRHRLVCLTLE